MEPHDLSMVNTSTWITPYINFYDVITCEYDSLKVSSTT